MDELYGVKDTVFIERKHGWRSWFELTGGDLDTKSPSWRGLNRQWFILIDNRGKWEFFAGLSPPLKRQESNDGICFFKKKWWNRIFFKGDFVMGRERVLSP
jgi:hypothetical protein